jgi:tRNA(Leu) C34 or U34 (ribose-2'-O)-methylase TrmL
MLKLVFDCLRAPYDWANILQVVIATGDCELYITGNSIRHDHKKIVGKVKSWSKKMTKQGLPPLRINYFSSFAECAAKLKEQEIKLIGTSSYAKKSFYELDLKKDNFAIVFGTETSGLIKEKIALLDDMVKLPMSDNLDFMTLSVVVPVIIYEAKRQEGLF